MVPQFLSKFNLVFILLLLFIYISLIKGPYAQGFLNKMLFFGLDPTKNSNLKINILIISILFFSKTNADFKSIYRFELSYLGLKIFDF